MTVVSNRVERIWQLSSPLCGLLECAVYRSPNGYTVIITFADEILSVQEVETFADAQQRAGEWRRALLPVAESIT